jgi:hypothetical protein
LLTSEFDPSHDSSEPENGFPCLQSRNRNFWFQCISMQWCWRVTWQRIMSVMSAVVNIK